MIDRPCRPLFPEGYKNDTQIIATVLSSDKENPTDVLAMTAASAALHISDIPWGGPLAAVRVARVEGELIAYPTFEQQAKADIDMVVAASKDAIVMVEGGAAEASEVDIIDTLMFAHRTAPPILELIERMRAAVGKPKRAFDKKTLPAAVAETIKGVVDKDILASSLIKDKKARYDGYKAAKGKMVEAVLAQVGPEEFPKIEKLVKEEFEERKYNVVREYVLSERKRIDGRDMKTIRAIVCEVGILPRVHGSALFQRGETQAAVAATAACVSPR
jgi:polyribonucleotide nucleotidyltransferase